MKKTIDPFEGAFDSLRDETLPTEEQKEKMLRFVLAESSLHSETLAGKAGRWVSTYPWRFAFGAGAVQAVVCTLIFGTNYTNLFLRLFG